MVLSSLYHTFECHASEKVAETCFSLDILGIFGREKIIRIYSIVQYNVTFNVEDYRVILT